MAGPRITFVLLLVSASMLPAAQTKAPSSTSKPLSVRPAALQVPSQFTATMSNTMVAQPVPLKMPNLLWMEAREAVAAVTERLHNSKPGIQGEGIVIAQDPPPEGDVSPQTRITLSLGLPAMTLAASTASPNINEDVTFTVTFDPPPPAPQKVEYHFLWGDGSADAPIADAKTTHRFPEAREYNVGSYAVIHGRWTVKGSGAALLPVAPPPTATDTTPTGTTQTQTTNTQTTATETAPMIATEPPVTTSTSFRDPVDSDPIPWQWIALAAAAIVILAAIIRFAIRKPRTPSAPSSPPKVAIRGGLGSTKHTIANPEHVRSGLTLRLSSGIRSGVVGLRLFGDAIHGGPNV